MRAAVIPGALFERVRRPRRVPPKEVRRVLVAHHLLLGDTLMLTPLLAKLRFHHPQADIVMTVARPFAPIYRTRPFGVTAVPFAPHEMRTLAPLLDGGGYDLGVVPGDNRYSWLAMAAGARWIIAFAGDTPAWKNWPVDEPKPYPNQPAAWGDMVAELVSGLAPPPFRPTDWPDPECAVFPLPAARRFAVLHVGASTMLKLWEPDKWRALALHLEQHAIEPVLLCGRGEEGIVARVDPQGRYTRYAGNLRLEQVWRLLRAARSLNMPAPGQLPIPSCNSASFSNV